MSEWLDLMLEEIERKKQEADEAKAESERREDGASRPPVNNTRDGKRAQSR